MVESTQDRNSHHLVRCTRRGKRQSLRFRELLLDALMWSCLVEKRYIPIEHALELLLAEDQQMVEALFSHTPHEAFADRIGTRCMIRGFKNLNGTRCGHTSKAGPKFSIVITNQVFWRLPIRCRLSQLLRHPRIGRRCCTHYMDHPSRVEFDDEKGKERTKEEIRDLQEVASPNVCRVIVQKGGPPLSSCWWCTNLPHVFLDGALTDMDTQFQQFTADPLSTPKSIFARHLFDQGNRFCCYLRHMRSDLRPALPDQAKELTMPTQKCVWLNNKKC